MPRITDRERRAATHTGYIGQDEAGSWVGLLTDRAGNEVALRADVDRMGDMRPRLSLVGTWRRAPVAAPGETAGEATGGDPD